MSDEYPEKIWIANGWTRRWNDAPLAGGYGEVYVRADIAATLRARVADLEAVLRSIADDWSGEVEWPGGDEEEAASYASRARAALKE